MAPDRQDQHPTLIPLKAADYFIFASTRNPFDRAVSLWSHSQSKSSLLADSSYPMSFAQFVLEYQPQATWFYRLSQSELLAPLRVDAVVRFDHLKEDLYRLPSIAAAVRAGEVMEPLPWLNKTSHPPWQKLLAPLLADVIAYHWSADLDLCQAS